jgi:hypothetical protein
MSETSELHGKLIKRYHLFLNKTLICKTLVIRTQFTSFLNTEGIISLIYTAFGSSSHYLHNLHMSSQLKNEMSLTHLVTKKIQQESWTRRNDKVKILQFLLICTVLIINISILWNVISCSLVDRSLPPQSSGKWQTEGGSSSMLITIKRTTQHHILGAHNPLTSWLISDGSKSTVWAGLSLELSVPL